MDNSEKPSIAVEYNASIQPNVKDEIPSSSNSDIEQNDGPIRIAGEITPITDLAQGVIGWDSTSDPQNPKNWTSRKKGILMASLAILSTLSPLTSTLVAPAIPQTMASLSTTSPIIGSFMISIYMLGFTIGPLFLGPLSELYGRYPIVIGSSWFLCGWITACAVAPTMASLIGFRLLAGIGGSAVMTIAPAVVSDLYVVERRARASSVIVLTQSVGPALGPICGGFVAENLGWRWGYWILLIATALVTTFMTISMPESYAPTLLARKTTRLRQQTSRDDLVSLLDQKLSRTALLTRAIIRPTKLLTRSPIVFLICSYVATIFGILYLLMTTIPMVFTETYGWTSSYVGLAYTPLGAGMVTALLVIMRTNDRTVIKLTRANNGAFEPEFRLPSSFFFALFIPSSLLIYTLTISPSIHYTVPILALFPFGFGMLGIFLPCQTYLVDAFVQYAASAVAVSRASMSIMGAVLPLVGPVLFRGLGYKKGGSVLVVLGVVMAPIPWGLYRWGGWVRKRWVVEL